MMKKMAMVVLSIIISFAVCAGSVWAIQENDSNTWVGSHAGGSITSGTDNSFFGYYAGNSTSSGDGNSFIGWSAGIVNTTGRSNSFLGVNAGQGNHGGGWNTFLGGNAGYSNNNGNYNSYLGFNTGFLNSGNGNVFIGYYAGSQETGSNMLYIDNCFLTSGSPNYYCDKPLIKGDFENRWVQVDGALYVSSYATPSDIRLKKNIVPLKTSLDKVMHLQGVSYEWRTEENSGRGFGKGREIGLIAQDVEAVIPELVITDGKGYKALAYDKLIPVLVEAMKEQEAVIREQEKQNLQKEDRIMKLEKALELMEKRIASIENPAKTIALK
jgi:trimeric autotransporter adhesin